MVTGQKVWTSGAQYSKWCMLVARTDPEVPKHKGLTYFLMDMEQDAVQVRPLRQITGEAEFNELFLDGARIPDENVLGGVGNGWKVALTTLMNERAGLAFFLQVRLRQLLDRLIDEAAARGPARRPGGRRPARRAASAGRGAAPDRLPRADRDREVRPAGPEGSLTKWMWSETNQQLTQFAADLLGPEALQRGRPLGLRAAARARQLDRGRHHRGAQEHRRRARARPAEGALRRRFAAMDFDLTEDQREIKHVARELLAARSPLAKRARGRRGGAPTTTALWRELVELGWPGIAVAEEHGGQGLGPSSWRCCSRSSGTRARPRRCSLRAAAAAVIQAGGSEEQRDALAAGAGVGRAAGAGRHAPSWPPTPTGAAVVVLLIDGDDGAALLEPRRRPSRSSTIDPTRRFARVLPGDGEPLGAPAPLARPRSRSPPRSWGSASARSR